MNDNVTCNPAPRSDIDELFSDPNNNIDYFICGTDIDNNYGGSLSWSQTQFMYARSSGFVSYNKTERGATILLISEKTNTNC